MSFDLLTKACDLINDFCLSEYDGYADLSNLENVALAYTTDEDCNDIQVSVDLVNFRLITEHQGRPDEVMQFDDLEDLIDRELRYLDFGMLVSD